MTIGYAFGKVKNIEDKNNGRQSLYNAKGTKWARETARMYEETAADKVSVPVERLKEWEGEISQPTIRQAETLAKAYRRPFALFFCPRLQETFNLCRITEEKLQTTWNSINFHYERHSAKTSMGKGCL